MQIVIDIDEREWMDEKSIREVAFEYKKGSGFDRAIREGLRQAIVLPKGHGRLIDADEAIKTLKSLGNRDYRRNKGTIQEAEKMLSYDGYTPTIIEGSGNNDI